MKLEQALEESKWFIKKSAYHGGDYEGRALRILMEHASDIFSEVIVPTLQIIPMTQ